ncbi:hypothetical protein OIU77_015783 [Salix suchowensis]|uniref:Uncharacterized protein n=1 Tax=Salix suchowensis TaxID=1278906 RepID=A0ABQ8ZI83_9ROSI|nr:hypothetical protein OIU77_015783 [Salix suchowensis]
MKLPFLLPRDLEVPFILKSYRDRLVAVKEHNPHDVDGLHRESVTALCFGPLHEKIPVKSGTADVNLARDVAPIPSASIHIRRINGYVFRGATHEHERHLEEMSCCTWGRSIVASLPLAASQWMKENRGTFPGYQIMLA